MTGLPRSLTPIAHGYTAADVYDLAVYAVHTDNWRPTLEWSDRVQAAWSAVALALVEANTPPPRRELVYAARGASQDVIDSHMRHRGIDKRASTFGEQRVNFERYWVPLAHTPLADRVVDDIALSQIWPQLKSQWREALTMLAVHGDYATAADALGLRYHAFCARISRARAEFLRLWHEGEVPSAVWGRDKRRGRDTGKTAIRVLQHRRRCRTYAAKRTA